MHGLNEKQLKKKYAAEHTVLYPLADQSGAVIGQEVDEENHLVYVVKQGEQISIVHASGVAIKRVIHETPGWSHTVTVKK